MDMKPGTRLGPYEIVAPLGAGGMGEVYRAKDTRLEREVAIKVLPADLAANPDFKQRFEREAKTISSLSHPHICALYDVGHEDGVDFLVMELLEGETLAERIKRGALPAEQVQRLGIQIAEALDGAHRRGLIHRDLKPGNVMLTQSGAKLMDFGLAKPGAAPRGGSSLTAMPTQTTPLTAEGTLVGTFQYMSPEQIEGKDADVRSDIFALGAVLYEMSTGKRAFEGKSQISVMASILEKDPPPMSDLQPMTPPGLERLVRTCLAKDPEERFQSAKDVKLQLEWVAEGGSRAGAPAVVVRRRKSRERIAWAVSVLLLLAAAAFAVGFVLRAPEPPDQVRFRISPPADLTYVGAPRISPDGKMVAFSAAEKGGSPQIWVRPMDALKAHVLPGTDGAQYRPFWSPDSRFIGFIAHGKLQKVGLTGAPPQTICDVPSGADGSWGSGGVILFDGRQGDPIRRVSASGGVPVAAVKSSSGGTVAWPFFFPDGRHFLYFASGGQDKGHIMAGSLDAKVKPKELVASDSLGWYAPPGFLLYVKNETLVAVPFDASDLKVTGEPVPVADNVNPISTGLASFSASDNGTLVYGASESSENRIVWLDRAGKEISEVGKPLGVNTCALSPDGTRLAMSIRDAKSGRSDIWIRDLERGVTSRLTFDPKDEFAPVWSKDGKSVIFASDRGGTNGIYEKSASGTGPTKKIWTSQDRIIPGGLSPDGRFLAVNRWAQGTVQTWILPMAGSKKPYAFLHASFQEGMPVFSPDGHYMAYVSNETGRFEIYVRRFPGPSGKWQVSAEGGIDPQWSADGRTIYFRSLNSKLMAAPVTPGAGFQAGVPKALFTAEFTAGTGVDQYQVSRDGKKILLITPTERQKTSPITVILHWDKGIKR
jgi:Tol biopolymer transport system component